MTDEAVNAERSPAQFFFEIGYLSCLAEAYARNGAIPFVASDASIERAWSIAGDAHDDPAEFARYVALFNRATDREGTSAASWRVNGEADPHGDRYSRERANLCGGQMTDDQVANAVYMDPSIINLTAAKERIRWLSRALDAAPVRQPIADLTGEAYKAMLSQAEADIAILTARLAQAEGALRAIPLHRLDPSMRDAIRAALAAPQAGGKGGAA